MDITPGNANVLICRKNGFLRETEEIFNQDDQGNDLLCKVSWDKHLQDWMCKESLEANEAFADVRVWNAAQGS